MFKVVTHRGGAAGYFGSSRPHDLPLHATTRDCPEVQHHAPSVPFCQYSGSKKWVAEGTAASSGRSGPICGNIGSSTGGLGSGTPKSAVWRDTAKWIKQMSRKGSFAQRAFTQRSYVADADDSVKSDVPHVI